MPAGPLALLVAFALSPVCVEIARHLIEEPWKAPVLVIPLALGWLVRDAWAAEREVLPATAARARRTGLLCIGLAVALELLAVGGGLPRWGRPALALAVFGWLRAGALIPTASAALASFLVPFPSVVSRAFGPSLVDGWRGLASAILPGVQRDAFPLELHHGDAGWAVAWAGAGLGAFAARRLGTGPAAGLAAMALGSLAGFVCQAAGVLLAAAMSAPLGPTPSRALLTVAPSLLLLAVVLGALSRALPREPGAREAHP